MMYYYRTSDPAKVAVVKKFDEDRAALHKKADEFALLLGIGVKALMSVSIHGTKFAGIKLPANADGDILDPLLWTHKTELRTPLKNVPSSLRAKSKSLHELWNKRPKEVVSREPVFELLGCSWGDFIFGGRFSYFLLNGVFYVECSSPDATGELGEILTRSYASAKKEFEEGNKNAASN